MLMSKTCVKYTPIPDISEPMLLYAKPDKRDPKSKYSTIESIQHTLSHLAYWSAA